MSYFLNTNTTGKQIYKAFSYRLYLHKLRQVVSPEYPSEDILLKDILHRVDKTVYLRFTFSYSIAAFHDRQVNFQQWDITSIINRPWFIS